MSKCDSVNFVCDNQAIYRVRVSSCKTINRGIFSGSLAAIASSNEISRVSVYRNIPAVIL